MGQSCAGCIYHHLQFSRKRTFSGSPIKFLKVTAVPLAQQQCSQVCKADVAHRRVSIFLTGIMYPTRLLHFVRQLYRHKKFVNITDLFISVGLRSDSIFYSCFVNKCAVPFSSVFTYTLRRVTEINSYLRLMRISIFTMENIGRSCLSLTLYRC